jgi:cytochrome P450
MSPEGASASHRKERKTSDYPSVKVELSAKLGPPMSHWQEIDELREKHSFFWNTEGPGYWVLTRYDEIREAFQSPEIFCNHSIVATDPDPVYRFLPSFIDPPEHMKYRQVMNRWFAPAAVEKFRPVLAGLARDLVSGLIDEGQCDFLTTFGDQYPVRAFLTTMGLPLDDADWFVSCVRRLSAGLTDPAQAAETAAAWGEIAAYWADLLARRRVEPADPEVDFVTHLTRSTIDSRPLPDADINDICVTLTLGSLDTLKSQLGWCFFHLATNPDDRKRLVESPDLIPGAVEEFLRAYPIVSMARKATRDVDFHGCPIKKDDMVLLSIQSATRDPRVFPDPANVIIDRKPNRHIAFGASEHRCLGSHLARAELQIAIDEWHRQIPEYRVTSEEPLEAHGGQVSLVSLPLTWAD